MAQVVEGQARDAGGLADPLKWAREIESGRMREAPSLHPLCQILGAQMGVSLQHLHRLVPRDAGDLHGVEPLFLKEPGCGLMAHVV